MCYILTKDLLTCFSSGKAPNFGTYIYIKRMAHYWALQKHNTWYEITVKRLAMRLIKLEFELHGTYVLQHLTASYSPTIENMASCQYKALILDQRERSSEYTHVCQNQNDGSESMFAVGTWNHYKLGQLCVTGQNL
jgi:hypothetical protein